MQNQTEMLFFFKKLVSIIMHKAHKIITSLREHSSIKLWVLEIY